MTADPSAERGIVLTPRLLWAFGSIAGIIAGSLGPWITLGAISVSGTGNGRDGTITLVLGVVAAVLVVIERGRFAVGVLASISLVIAAIDGAQVLRSQEDTIIGSLEIGWGLIVLALGAVSLRPRACSAMGGIGAGGRDAAQGDRSAAIPGLRGGLRPQECRRGTQGEPAVASARRPVGPRAKHPAEASIGQWIGQ